MKYDILRNVVDLLEDFEATLAQKTTRPYDIGDFKRWIVDNYKYEEINEPTWEGKNKGRSADSVICTLIVHMNRYARSYSKSAIFGSDLSTQEDFIYLINLKSLGKMTKMELIKKNVHEKPTGMQIINRLVAKGWVNQTASKIDKRQKFLAISETGIQVLESQMHKIRKATEIVSGDLTHNEKMQLIRLLSKLNDFHQPIYDRNIEPGFLLDEVLKDRMT